MLINNMTKEDFIMLIKIIIDLAAEYGNECYIEEHLVDNRDDIRKFCSYAQISSDHCINSYDCRKCIVDFFKYYIKEEQ